MESLIGQEVHHSHTRPSSIVLAITGSPTPMPMLCLVATNAQGQTFQIPYDWIEGFRHAEGVGYVISVRPQIDANKNEMTGHWVLDRVVSQGVRK